MRIKNIMYIEGDVLPWEVGLIKVEDPEFSFGCIESEVPRNFQVKM